MRIIIALQLYSLCGTMRRPFLEIDCHNLSSYHIDPVNVFLDNLHLTQNITDPKVIEANKSLLTGLIHQGYISRTSIIWDNNCISKIYGISLDNNGYVQCHNKNHTERTVSLGNPIDDKEVDSIKKAFLRAKQTKLWRAEVHS